MANAAAQVTDTDDKKKQAQIVATPTSQKEHEQALKSEGEEVREQIRSQEALDAQALESVQEEIEDARLKEPPPKLDNVATSVSAPQLDANKVITNGATLEVPISEEEYLKGQKEKIEVKKDWTTMVYWGPKSLIAAVIRAGRLIKMAHSHAMRVVFKKGGV